MGSQAKDRAMFVIVAIGRGKCREPGARQAFFFDEPAPAHMLIDGPLRPRPSSQLIESPCGIPVIC
jgi:hypothetical protein